MPWDLLGLEPTSDNLEIKRAYARKLKHTRPDHDARAYQRLREAYEAALEQAQAIADQAKSAESPPAELMHLRASEDLQTLMAVDADLAHPAYASATPQDSTSATDDGLDRNAAADSEVAHEGAWAPTAEIAEESEELPSPEHLARSLHAFVHENGAQATRELWPRIHFELDRLPLALRDEASHWFARLCAEVPEMPDETVGQLADYFQWFSDYRSRACIGEDIAVPIQQRLRAIGWLRERDPEVLQRYEGLTTLARLQQSGPHPFTRLLALLSSERNAELMAETTPAKWRGLGLDADSVAGLTQVLRRAAWTRLGLLWMLLQAYAFAITGSAGVVDWLPVYLAAIGLLLATLACEAARLPFDLMSRSGWGAPERWAAQTRHAEAIGLSLAGAIIAARHGEAAGVLVASGAALIGLWLAWSPQQPWRAMLVPLIAVFSVGLMVALGLRLGTAIGMASTWVMVARWAITERASEVHEYYQSPWNRFRPQTYGQWVWAILLIKFWGMLLLAVMVMITPLNYLVQARGFGLRSALAALGFAAAIGTVHWPDHNPLLYAVVLAPILMALAQLAFDSLAKHLLRRL